MFQTCVILVGEFREELDAYEPDVLFGVFVIKIVDGGFKVVSFALAEILIDVIDTVFVHDFFEEIIDIEACAAIDDGFDFVEQFVKLHSVHDCDVVECHLSVDALDNADLEF